MAAAPHALLAGVLQPAGSPARGRALSVMAMLAAVPCRTHGTAVVRKVQYKEWHDRSSIFLMAHGAPMSPSRRSTCSSASASSAWSSGTSATGSAGAPASSRTA